MVHVCTIKKYPDVRVHLITVGPQNIAMTLLLIFTLLTLVTVAFFLIRRRAKPPIKSQGGIEAGFGIPMTEQEVELERQSNEEIIKLLEASIITSGFFRAEKIPELIAKLKGGAVPFGRTNTRVAFEGDNFLTVEEKKVLGLNTRMKYSKKFIEYFDASAFKVIEPKASLERMHLDAFHRVSRKKQLIRLKKQGFVKQVKIVPTGDGGDCGRIKQFKKIYGIEEVPELPLPDCDAQFCRCMYQAIIPEV